MLLHWLPQELDSCYSWLIGQWKSIHPNRQGLGKSSTSFSSSTGLITTASARFNSWLILLLHVLIHSVCGGTFCSLKVNRFIRVTEADLWHRFQLVWRLILCLVLRALRMKKCLLELIWNANSMHGSPLHLLTPHSPCPLLHGLSVFRYPNDYCCPLLHDIWFIKAVCGLSLYDTLLYIKEASWALYNVQYLNYQGFPP